MPSRPGSPTRRSRATATRKTRSRRCRATSPSAEWPSPRTSRTWRCSSPPTRPATSPAKRSTSTAGNTCPDRTGGGPDRPSVFRKTRYGGSMDARFQGKVAVITGGAGGIGRATAVRLAHEGARIVAVDVAKAGLADTVAAVAKTGSEAIAVEADVSRDADVQRYLAAARERYGR